MHSNDLNSRMEMDHVVSILPGGRIEDGPEGIHAPELFDESADDAELIRQAEQQGWTLLSGWTGQYGYSGVCMHPSEFIGGRLAEHILCNPGLYVAMVAECDPEDCECGWEDACQCASEEDCTCECTCETEPAGWLIAFRPMVRESGAYRCPCCGDDFVGTAYICDECDASGCEQTHDRSGDVGYWECSREDVTESGFVATINVPGYSPMDDEPPVFETPWEAWEYLADERERAENDADNGEGEGFSQTLATLRQYVAEQHETGTVYGDTPGYEGEHDLGLAYCVSEV